LPLHKTAESINIPAHISTHMAQALSKWRSRAGETCPLKNRCCRVPRAIRTYKAKGLSHKAKGRSRAPWHLLQITLTCL
jgi:hypothetical protein